MPSYFYEFSNAYALLVNVYGDGYYIFEKTKKLKDIAEGKFIVYIERDYSSNYFMKKSIDSEITKVFQKIKLKSLYDSVREKEFIFYRKYQDRKYEEIFKIKN
ncbi:hypothetical protein [Paenibacillus sp. Marseille-Q4541]|uniref:hypothetical protein n=1 Tax=Paenibacillus sp. Marseille-Q4541 TaxID=2831522 RepID=UPI001BA9CE13|nr:hypothetical protein [Paenibacillus sp. Marseille-Q4541]